MNSPSKDIADMLVAHSALSLTLGTDLFIGKEKDMPNDCVTIYDTPGYGDDLTMDIEKYERPSVQIRVRSDNYAIAWQLANDIKDQLHGRANETWNGSFYTVILCTNGPALLDYDERNRARFIINFNLQRRR